MRSSITYFFALTAVVSHLPAIGSGSDEHPELAGKLVIAHRGASGYLPEHTLEAYAFAYAQGADYLEADLMITKDSELIALHDRSLNATTDVARQFPGRAREDGQFLPSDFTLSEIKQLRVHERLEASDGQRRYPERWRNAHSSLHFQIPTLAEIVELVQGLNVVTGRTVGIYPEIKSGQWHREEGFDFERILLDELARFGLTGPEDPVHIQSFEACNLMRLRELGTELRLVQLIGGGSRFDEMVSDKGLDAIAEYANGIGPSVWLIFNREGEAVDDFALVRGSHARGMVVHPYTMRSDDLPAYAENFEQLLEKILFEAGADGVFSDHPGQVVEFLRARSRQLH